jgi:transposase
VADVACGGRQVQLLLAVRKFFCDSATCARKIFTERLAPFVAPWARRTTRLAQALFDLGRATCGKPGARLAARLWMPTSWKTILRRIMAVPTPPVGLVSQLGLDDWSFRRQKQFGAILVNLETHRILDLLPDRLADTAATWMQAHPEIELVSRDRSKEFATAVAQGAPQAVQVVDRFHLMKNLVEQVDVVLARCLTQLRRALPRPTPPTAEAASATPAPPWPTEWKPTPARHIRQGQSARHELRLAQYERMLALRQQGHRSVEIAQQLGMKARTVWDWLHHFRQDPHRRKRTSAFDAFAPYVWQRWQDGETSGSCLWKDLCTQGYTGSERTVYRYLQTLRRGFIPSFAQARLLESSATPSVTVSAPQRCPDANERPTDPLPAQARLDDFTQTQIKWFLVRTPDTLTADEQAHLVWLCDAHPTLQRLYELVQGFRRVLRERQEALLHPWISDCQRSGIGELRQFAKGLLRELDWVVAAVTQAASNDHVAYCTSSLGSRSF